MSEWHYHVGRPIHEHEFMWDSDLADDITLLANIMVALNEHDDERLEWLLPHIPPQKGRI